MQTWKWEKATSSSPVGASLPPSLQGSWVKSFYWVFVSVYENFGFSPAAPFPDQPPPHCPRSIPNTRSSHSKLVGLGIKDHRCLQGERGKREKKAVATVCVRYCRVQYITIYTTPAVPGPVYSWAGYASESLRHGSDESRRIGRGAL